MINSREKGARAERLCAEMLTQLIGLKVTRGCQYRGGPDSADVVGLPGIHVEVKNRLRLNLDRALEQAINDANPADVPICIHRADRRPWKITFLAKDLHRFLDAVNALIRLASEQNHHSTINQIQQGNTDHESNR